MTKEQLHLRSGNADLSEQVKELFPGALRVLGVMVGLHLHTQSLTLVGNIARDMPKPEGSNGLRNDLVLLV